MAENEIEDIDIDEDEKETVPVKKPSHVFKIITVLALLLSSCLGLYYESLQTSVFFMLLAAFFAPLFCSLLLVGVLQILRIVKEGNFQFVILFICALLYSGMYASRIYRYYDNNKKADVEKQAQEIPKAKWVKLQEDISIRLPGDWSHRPQDSTDKIEHVFQANDKLAQLRITIVKTTESLSPDIMLKVYLSNFKRQGKFEKTEEFPPGFVLKEPFASSAFSYKARSKTVQMHLCVVATKEYSITFSFIQLNQSTNEHISAFRKMFNSLKIAKPLKK